MTFTNKAAQEMVERVDKLVGGLSVAKPVISTFHSFCVRVLRRDIEALRIPSTVPGQPPIGLTKSFVIYDETDQQQVVKSVMRRLGIDDKQTHAALGARAHFLGEESHARSAGSLSAVGRSQDGEGRAHLRGVSQGAAQSQRARFRRPAARDRAPAESGSARFASTTTGAFSTS